MAPFIGALLSILLHGKTITLNFVVASVIMILGSRTQPSIIMCRFHLGIIKNKF
ncbi:MAG: hypothetical protein J6M54_05715 [Prevotella sp.]|nr:hypothetical protein [Prevotella sp.]